MPVQQLGRYEIIGELGRGAMGVVYKARDPLIERIVAIKSVSAGMSPEEADAFERRFYREAKSAGRLNHPNIVTIHDVGKSGEHAYIAMEFLEGQSLREILDSGVVLPLELTTDIAAQVADGLAFAHQNDIVHRDIKPANIMVLYNGMVKITDFGIALLQSGSKTLAGAIFGSPKYIAPEQVVGKDVDGRSDIFALGAVLYEMLTGVPPFNGTELNAILYQVINETPAPPSTRSRRITPAFDYIVAKSMAKHPDERYQSIQEMAADLRNHAKLIPPTTAKALDPNRTLERRASRRPKAIPTPAGGHTVRTSGGATIQTQGQETIRIDVAEPAAPPKTQAANPIVNKASNVGFLQQRKLFLYGLPLVLLVVLAGWAVLHGRTSRSVPAPEQVATTDASQTEAPTGVSTESQKSAVAPPSFNEPAPAGATAANQGASTSAANNGNVEPEKAGVTRSPSSPVSGSDKPSASTGTAQPDKAVETVPPPVPGSGSEKASKAKSKKLAASASAAASKNQSVESTKLKEPASGSSASDKKKGAAKPPATVVFAISPWGEIFVDGRQEGISPPLKELNLPAGKHIIEIRNTHFPPHKETVDLAPEANIKVKHKFQ